MEVAVAMGVAVVALPMVMEDPIVAVAAAAQWGVMRGLENSPKRCHSSKDKQERHRIERRGDLHKKCKLLVGIMWKFLYMIY